MNSAIDWKSCGGRTIATGMTGRSFKKGQASQRYFCEMPEDPPVPVVDKRQEVKEFDVEAGLRSIGAGPIRPPLIGSPS